MLEKAMNDYYEKFGKPYPLMIVDDKTDAEIIKEIEECIKNDKEAEPFEYEEGVVY